MSGHDCIPYPSQTIPNGDNGQRVESQLRSHSDERLPPLSATGPYTASPKSTDDLLISKTTQIIHHFNIRQYDSPLFSSFLSPHVRTDHNGNISTGIPAAIQAYKWAADINPKFHTRILEAAAMVYEDSGRATVLCSLDMTNCTDDTIRAGQLSTSWKKEKGKGWMCWNWEMVFGIREFF